MSITEYQYPEECPICLREFTYENIPYDFISSDFNCSHIYCSNCIDSINLCSLCNKNKLGKKVNLILLRYYNNKKQLDTLKIQIYNHRKELLFHYINYKVYEPLQPDITLNDITQYDITNCTPIFTNINKSIYYHNIFKNNDEFYNKICAKISNKYNIINIVEKLCKLNHESIINVYHHKNFVIKKPLYNVTNSIDEIDLHYFIMIYYNTNLYNLIYNKIISNTLLIFILRKIIHAIKYAHSCNIIHGDINLYNIVMNDFNLKKVKLVGWNDNIYTNTFIDYAKLTKAKNNDFISLMNIIYSIYQLDNNWLDYNIISSCQSFNELLLSPLFQEFDKCPINYVYHIL